LAVSEPGRDDEGPAEAEPEAASLRRDAAAAVGILLMVVGAVAAQRLIERFGSKPSRAQCERLLEHYLDRASRQHHPGIPDHKVQDAIAAASADPARGPDLRTCEHELTASQVECGLASSNVDELERCLQ
jgi:hypothetical protein